jgi:FKBP-type peptidyl-prolyl cis-trans isomerase FkpA
LGDEPISPIEQGQKEVKAIDDYLAANPPSPSATVVKDASGIRLVITKMGTGLIPPNQDNILKVSYVGRLFSNGSVFDSNEAFFFSLSDNVINGWKIGLGMLTEGAEATVYIPSLYAYGPNGSGSIPGNATLKFEIKMLLVEPTSAQEAQLTTQKAVISGKLEGVENVTVLPTGISIIHNQIGTGLTPGLYDQVVVKYSGRLLSDDTEFRAMAERGPASDFSSRVVNYLHGELLAMQQMQEGGKATVYVPAILGYGPVSVNGVPANANLIYEIELVQVIQ